MQLLNVIILGFLVACVPNFASPHSTQDTPDLWERELQLSYQIAFEKRLYVNLEEMHILEATTRAALQDTSIASRNFDAAQQQHHKLKSYLSYLYVANALEDSGLIRKNLTALMLDKLRQTPAALIDTTQSNEAFFQQAVAGEFNTTDIDNTAKQEFFQALLATIVAMTEDTLRLQSYLFPFMVDDFREICRRYREENCVKFFPDTQAPSFVQTPFSDIKTVTARVNDAIDELNLVINTLNRLQVTKQNFIFSRTDFENKDVIKLYQYYELTLMGALKNGVLSIMFADIFRKHSGNVWLKQNGVGEVNNKLLTAVTPMTVTIALRETQQNLLDGLQQLRKMQASKSLPRDKKIYQWVVNNEVATARVIAQNPAQALVVANLLHQYQDKARNPMLVLLDTAITRVELSCLLMIVPALASSTIPALAAFNLPRTVAFVGTLMNFPWIGMTQTKHIIARNRYLMLERALLRGSSQRITYSLKLLHEMQRLRKYAIISGGLGLAMSVPAMSYIINNTDVGFRNNLVDIVSSVFADYENFTLFMYENRIDMSESKLEITPGH